MHRHIFTLFKLTTTTANKINVFLFLKKGYSFEPPEPHCTWGCNCCGVPSCTVKNESAVPTPFVVSSLCKCDTWCSPSTPGCHTSTLGCHLSTLGCHCSTHGVTLAPLGCHHSTKSWCHIRTHVIFNSVISTIGLDLQQIKKTSQP